MPISQELLPPLLFAVGVGVFVFIMLRRSRGVFRRAESVHASALREDRAQFGAARESEPTDYLRFQVEMQELARDLRAEIDTKLRALSAMQILAAQTLADLERAIEQANRLLPPRPPEPTSEPARTETGSEPPKD